MNIALIVISILIVVLFSLWGYKTISFARKYDVRIEGRLTDISKPRLDEQDELAWTKSKTTTALYVTNQEDAHKR